jgi:hypothetical protein
MDSSPDAFAYRCLPLNIANAHGWEVLSPCGLEAEWTGGPAVEDVLVRPDPGAERPPVALFGQGVLTFHIDGLFRTPPGYNLWVGGPPNAAKDAIAPLSGIVETDWSPYSFTMNWRFTRPGQVIRFEENEPFCLIFPVERALVGSVALRIRPIAEDPDLERQFETWRTSRTDFRAQVAAHPPATPADGWQKLYYRGVDAEGAPGPADHQAKLRLAEFDGAAGFHRQACPVAHARPPPASDTASPEKLEWLLGMLQAQRLLAPNRAIPRRRNLDAATFLEQHYAANWPVQLEGALADWPALGWTPERLKALVGAAEVQVQTGRAADADYERRMADHAATMPFDAFIDLVAHAGGNDTYLTAYNAAANARALAPLHADLGFLDELLDPAADRPRGMMWIGPAGTFTTLHHDLTNNLLLQVVGRKALLLASPAETPRLYNDHHVYSRVRDLSEPGIVDRFPKLEGLHVHRVILNPGDALFIPLGWWHQVTALDFSVTITHTNFRWPNAGYETHPS